MAPFQLILLSTLIAGSSAAPAALPASQYYSNKASDSSPHAESLAPGGHIADHQSHSQGQYQCFHNDAVWYLSMTDGPSFDALWRVNQPRILSINGGNTYVEHYVKEAIFQGAGEITMDARLILAVMMQESGGKAYIPCADDTANQGPRLAACYGKNPKASDTRASIVDLIWIAQHATVVREHFTVRGHYHIQDLHDNLQLVAQDSSDGPNAATRADDSGITFDVIGEVERSVPSYSTDIANRLLGWDGTGKGYKQCL